VVVGVSSTDNVVEEGVVVRHLVPYIAVLLAGLSLAAWAILRLSAP
jgi:hypothetical protein